MMPTHKDKDPHQQGFAPSKDDQEIIRRARQKMGQLRDAAPVSSSFQDRVASELGLDQPTGHGASDPKKPA
jgi:hypothetical protein